MRIASLLAALLAAVATGSALAQTSNLPQLPQIGIEGEDNRTRVNFREWPWTAIGRVNREVGGHCSGTLIAPDKVLTAAHCLYNREDGRWTIPIEVHFVAGYDRGSFAGHSRAKSFVVDPKYNPKKATDVAQMARDWAIITLAQELKIKPIPLATGEPADIEARRAQMETNAAGYNGDWAEILMRHAGCKLDGLMADLPLLVHECDTTFGASGGPLFYMKGDEIELIGVLSGVIVEKKVERGVAVPVWTFRPAAMR